MRAHIDGLRGQLTDETELLLIDDCSTNNSGEVCKEYADADSRIRYIRMEENGGLSSVRNRTIAEAQGKWIFFADGDDLFSEHFVETALRFQEAQEDIIIHERLKFLEQKQEEQPCTVTALTPVKEGAGRELSISCMCLDPSYGTRCGLSSRAFYHAAWGALYRKEFLVKNNLLFPVGQKKAQDAVFNTEAYFHAERIAYLPYIMYYYRGNPQGIKEFNAQIVDFCRRYEFDGVDVDFEFIASSPAWEYFEDWMLALRKQCDKNDLLLTAAVATWYSDNISKKAMDCFDYVMVMAYDNDGDRENHSKYEYAVSEMKHYENRGIAKNKLILGVPFYGYKYTSSGAMDWNSGASYRKILSDDSAAKNSDFSNGYAYNGEETIRKKAELSKQYGGIMIWELSQDADGSDSLLKIIKSVYQ